MKTRKPLGKKELHKLEETRDPWAEAIAGLKAYKRGTMHKPPHPGEVLWELHLKKTGISASEAALRLGVSHQAMSAILNGCAGISADMALRLADALGTSAEMWTGMQSAYDLWQAKQKKRPKVTTLLKAA